MEPSDLPHPIRIDRRILGQARTITQSLIDLNDLLSAEAGNPDKVRHYASASEERLRALVHLLTSIPLA